MSFFVKDLKATRSGLGVMLAVQLVMFLFGFLMVLGINMFLNDDRDYATIGSMMAMMIGVFAGLLRGGGSLIRFRTAISMGQTRRDYLLADPVVTALHCGAGMAFAWVLSKFELWIYSILYPGWELDFDIVGMMKWWYFLILIAAACILDICLGALQLKFGTKGFLVIWLPLCFSGTIISSTVGAAEDGGTSLLAQIGRGFIFIAGLLSPAMWGALGIALLVVCVTLSVLCYRKAEIRI